MMRVLMAAAAMALAALAFGVQAVSAAPPVFPNSSYSKTVAENAAVNSEVITVKSSTEGAEHELSGTGNDDFEIVKTTGVITVNKTLDYEKKNSYDLMVTARASGESTDVPLTITVPNVGPAFGKASYGFTVAEDAAANAEVGTVRPARRARSTR